MDDLFGEDEIDPRIGERITNDPEILVGKPTVRGTRLSVERVLQFLADDEWSSIYDAFPGISEDDVRACLAYGAEQVAQSWRAGNHVRADAA
jgi:uncharacterized protein (DUF433 family)